MARSISPILVNNLLDSLVQDVSHKTSLEEEEEDNEEQKKSQIDERILKKLFVKPNEVDDLIIKKRLLGQNLSNFVKNVVN